MFTYAEMMTNIRFGIFAERYCAVGNIFTPEEENGFDAIMAVLFTIEDFADAVAR